MAAEEPADFARLLRQFRDMAGLTQEELAHRARLGVTTVGELERGRHRTCQPQTARRLADGLGLSGGVRDVFVAIARGAAPHANMAATRPAGTAAVHGMNAGLPSPAGTPLAIGPGPVPRELPADVGAFTGRADELARLDALLPAVQAHSDSPAAPVVISAVAGTAGVGKTALAVRWAHRVAAQFPDGQLYINLRGYDHGELVPASEALAHFLRALGVISADIPVQEAERAARYRSLVSGKRLLVLLDNAATVDQIRPLLPGSGTVMVVVTSRDSLAGLIACDGAQRLELGALPAADAVALLRTLIGSRVDADPGAAQALVRLCARLPLALRIAAELAISRPHTPLTELVAELASLPERLARLDAGGDSPGTAASVFSWSYRHLSPEAARMFRLLGGHPGPGFDHYAAAALAGASMVQAAQQLEVLARAHLIQPVGRARYGMHDLLCAYAAGQALAVDDEQARRAALTRLFDYYLAACAAAMDSYAPAERHDRPARPAIVTPVPDLGDRASARAWLDTELPTLAAVIVHTAAKGWPGHATRLAATLFRYLDGGRYGEAIT